jgi:hypothetical protein
MTDELKNIDEEVRRAYRDVASERTPDALDKAVLRQAHKAVRPGYARSRAWTRPVAWAATVALCVAVVLEVARLPETPSVPRAEHPLERPAPDTAAAPASEQAEKMEAFELRRIVPTNVKDAERPMVPATVEKRNALEEAAAGEQQPPVEMLSGESQDAASPVAPVQQDSAVVEYRSGSIQPQDAAGDLPFFDSNEPCPPEMRAKPEDWAACIEALENIGLDDAASEQKRRLREAFPDFDLP